MPLVILPKAERLVTLREPSDAPPVTVSEVEVPTINANELSWVPPVTLNPPVEVALVKVELAAEREPSEVPPLTDNPVVVAFWKIELPETVRLPPKYTFPAEWTERRDPGVVVPMPTLPEVERNIVEVPIALLISLK